MSGLPSHVDAAIFGGQHVKLFFPCLQNAKPKMFGNVNIHMIFLALNSHACMIVIGYSTLGYFSRKNKNQKWKPDSADF